MTKRLHIITVICPNDPYSGVTVDIYHKMEAFHRAGIAIYLHCLECSSLPNKKLAQFCEQLYCYPPAKGLKASLGIFSGIFKGRIPTELLKNLQLNLAPVLFEGLKSCSFLDDPLLSAFPKFVRAHNIAHLHYFNLYRSSRIPKQRWYYLFQGFNAKILESKLKCADHILAVSTTEAEYLGNKFGRTHFIPPFHSFSEMTGKPGQGDYLIYHGNLEIEDNQRAVKYLMSKIFSQITESFVIAGKNPPEWLVKQAKDIPHITIVPNPSEDQMNQLIAHAQICLVPGFQPTGMKMKLLNSLFGGRHCLTNSIMVKGTDLKNLCHIADSPNEMIEKIRLLMEQEFGVEDIRKRKLNLETLHANELNAQKIIELL